MKKHNNTPQAVAVVRGGTVYGTVSFYQRKDSVAVVAHIDELPKNGTGFYGFHIHDGPSCGGTDFAQSGSHFNPGQSPHPSHAGDLPPLMLCNGGARMAVATDRFQIADIIGKTVIIHDSPDDFKTQPSGNAGAKIACGIIKKA